MEKGKTDNRKRLMECAEELFYAKGYDATGVQEIVEMAGVTKPTLYYYFGSKRGLLEALIDEKSGWLHQRIRDSMGSSEGIAQKLRTLARIYCRFFVEEHKFYMILMALFYSARENEAYQAVRPCLEDFYGWVLQFFENASSELGNMHGRQKQFAISFIGAVNQYLVYAWDQGILQEDWEARMDALTDQFMYGIFS